METGVKILFVEDYLADAELAQQVLLKEGITFQSRVVENEDDFINALENFVPDIIISDFALPKFDAMKVLKITLERKPEIPVILLTGSIDEATAVECIKNGAMDYIFKSHLSRLPFSIKEAIEKKKALAEKEKAEYELKESEERYRLLFEVSADGILIADVETKTFTYANPALCKLLGYTEEQFASMGLIDIHPKNDLQRVFEEFETLMRGEKSVASDIPCLKQDGSIVYVDISSSGIITIDGRFCIMGVFRDITERKLADEMMFRLNRELRAISICNQALLKAVDEQTLLNEICRIICEEAGYRLAWVGYAEHDEAKTIRPIAWAGFDSGYIANAKLTWSEDSEHGKGPAGTAIRSGEAIYVQDFLTDPLMVLWRESAIQHGYRSGIAIPLKDEENKVFGLLLVYSAEVGTMKPEEIQLLAELANDLSFGVMTLRMRAKQKIAEELLRASEECFSTTFHFSPMSFAIYRPSDGRIVDVNDVFVETIGYPREEIIGHTTDELNLYADPEDRIRIGKVLREKGSLENFEFGIRRKSGEIRTVLDSARLITIGGEKYYLSSIIDITERKKIEELLQTASRYTRSLIEASLDPLVTINPAGKITDVNEATEIVTGILREKLIGEDFTNYFTEPDKAKAGYQKVLAEGLVRDYPLTIQHSSGRTTDVLYNAVVYKNESGEIAGVFAAARDITERKQQEEALRVSEMKLKTIYEIIPVGITVLDENNKIVEANPAIEKILDISKDDLINGAYKDRTYLRSDKTPMPPDEYASARAVKEQKAINDVEIGIVKNDGKVIWTVVNAAPVSFLNWKVVLVTSDITKRKQFEDKLNESEEQYRKAQTIGHVGSWEYNIQTTLFWGSDEAKRIYGFDVNADTFSTDEVENCIPERERVHQALIDLIEHDKDYNLEFEIITNDTKTRKTLISVAYLERDEAGRPLKITGVIQDITARKRAEEKLRESEERFRRIAENARDVIYRMSLPDGKYEYVSPAAFKVFGYKPEEFYETSGLFKQIIHPDWQKYFEEQWENLIKGVMPPTYEYQIIHKSGQVRWINQRNILVRNENGNPVAIEGIVTDITKRKQVSENLKKSEEYYRLIVDTTDAVFYRLKYSTMKYEHLHPAIKKLTGYTPEEINEIGFKNIVVKVTKYHVEKVNIDLIVEEREQGKTPEWQADYQLRTKDGRLIWLADHSYPWVNESGDLEGSIGFLIDITERKLAENARKESEKKYKQIVETTMEGIIWIDNKQEITFVNHRFAEMLGYEPKEIIGCKLDTYFFTEDLEDHKAKMIERQQGIVEVYERRFKRKDETTLWSLISASPIFDEKGNYNGSIGMLADITQRKNNEEMQMREQLLLRTVIDNLPDAIYAKDINGCKILTNPADLENVGAKYGHEILGKTDYDVFPEDVASKFFEDDQAVIQTGKPILNREEFIIKPDGQKHWLLTSKLPLKDEKGKISGLVGIGRDITKRKEVEEKSKTLSKAIEQNPVSIVITNPDGIIEYVNPSFEKLSGYTSADVIGKTPRILNSGYHTGDFYKNLWTTIKAGNDFRCEIKNRKKNGEFYWENAMLSPIINEYGDISHFIAVKEDITEKKKMTEELIAAKEKAEEMSRLKSNFLANMSHELRTPLNGILGYADYLSSQLKDPELLETSMGIYDSGKRLSETLNFILDLSESESEHIQILAADVDVIPLVKDTIRPFAKEAAKMNLQFETIIKEENIFAHIEERLFCRVLYNLLDNALKFTKKGKITFEIGRELIVNREWFYFKVTDSGIGIAKDKIYVVWDEFRQVSEGLARSYEGVGLGLTISKKAVELMQGVITVESELGVGSTFTVEFPALSFIPKKEEEIQVKRIIPQVHPAVIQPEKEKTEMTALPLLLHIEDDFANRNVIKYFLKNICTIETVGDGETALQLINEKKYDVILVDINLGEGMNGLTLVQEVLKIPRYANTPIIAVTAFAMEQDKTEFLKGGCTHYISKPFKKDEIVNLVTGVIGDKD